MRKKSVNILFVSLLAINFTIDSGWAANKLGELSKERLASKDCLTLELQSDGSVEWDDVCYKTENPQLALRTPAVENPFEKPSKPITPSTVSTISQNTNSQENQNIMPTGQSEKTTERKKANVSLEEDGSVWINGVKSSPGKPSSTSEDKEKHPEAVIPAPVPTDPLKTSSDTIVETANMGNDDNTSTHVNQYLSDEKLARTQSEKIQSVENAREVGQSSLFMRLSDEVSAEFNLSAGYRKDNLNWTIAGDSSGQNPNVLSELKWSDLESYQARLDSEVVFQNKYVLEGMGSYGEIFDGDNQDSDFFFDNRQGEFSRSNNSSDEGDVRDISGGVGYRFNVNSDPDFFAVDTLYLTPLAGYSHHEQNLVVTDGFQTLPATGAFPGLHSQYDTQWDGPWLGVKLNGSKGRLNGLFRFEYHFADYYAEADWNLRPTFQHPKSFEHEADGYGLVLGFGVDYQLTQNWTFGAHGDYQKWNAEDGVDRTFFTDEAVIDLGLPGNVLETRLNDVEWDALSWRLSLRYQF